MTTHQDETLPQRYAREHQDYLKLCGSMTAEQVADIQLQLHNSLAREQALQQRLTAADERVDEFTREREKLIAYGRSCGLDEASTLCSRLAYDTYYPAGSRFKHFIPKALEQQGNLLIKAANAIASLPGGPYDRFKARQAKKAGSTKSQ